MRSSSQQQVTLYKLLEDLKTQPKLCSLEDYKGITLDVLNQHLKEQGPLENPYFGSLYHFCVEEDKLIPTPMFVFGKEVIVGKIYELLGNWVDWNPEYGGSGTISQGAFIIGPNRDVRMPDVAYIPRDIFRNLTQQQQWTYRGEPFAPSFVVQVDTLTGPQSQLDALDYKMKHLNQEPGSSDEEEIKEALVCPYANCRQEFHSRSEFAAHVEWHRAEIAKQKYFERRH